MLASGITIAFLAYRQFYPPLSSIRSHKPYSPRIPADEPTLPTHMDGTPLGSSMPVGNGVGREFRDSTERMEMTPMVGGGDKAPVLPMPTEVVVHPGLE